MVKNPPAMLETRVQSLGWEDPLEKGKATHSSTLAWRIPWTEEPGGLQSMRSQRAGHDGATKRSTYADHVRLVTVTASREAGRETEIGMERQGIWNVSMFIHFIIIQSMKELHLPRWH